MTGESAHVHPVQVPNSYLSDIRAARIVMTVTPEMIEAGALHIRGEIGGTILPGDLCEADLAEGVFLAMLEAGLSK